MGEITTLDSLRPGEKARVVHVEGGPGIVRKLSLMGFTPGARIEVVSMFRGPILVKVRGSVVALGRGVARRILVERIEE